MSDKLQSALMRIEASRGRLQRALLPPPEPEEPAAGADASGPRTLRRWRAMLRRWVAGTPLAPLVKPAWSAARGWWHLHPWRATGVALGRAVNQEIAPLVRSHPVASVAVAAGLGAAIVAARPWRWQPLASQAQLAGRRALDSTLAWSWQQLSQPSVQMALATALAAWGGKKAVDAAEAADDGPRDPVPPAQPDPISPPTTLH